MKHTNVTNSNTLTDEVEINLDMLRTLMLNRIGGEIHSTYIVTIDKCRPCERTVKFQKELSQPASLSNTIGNRPVLSSALERDTVV